EDSGWIVFPCGVSAVRVPPRAAILKAMLRARVLSFRHLGSFKLSFLSTWDLMHFDSASVNPTSLPPMVSVTVLVAGPSHGVVPAGHAAAPGAPHSWAGSVVPSGRRFALKRSSVTAPLQATNVIVPSDVAWSRRGP